jgi:mannose-binding lectin 2
MLIFSIISVSSYTAILSRADSGRDKITERAPPPSGKGTWLGFFFKLFLLAGVVTGGYYGYQEYLRRQMYGGGGNGNYGGFSEMFPSNSRY